MPVELRCYHDDNVRRTEILSWFRSLSVANRKTRNPAGMFISTPF